VAVTPRVDFVLVRPARPPNVAAACRALKNMGFTSLVLVGTDPGTFTPTERALAYGAWDVLDGARRCNTLAEAVREAGWVVGTTGRPDEAALTPRAFALRLRRAGARRTAVVFGPESHGLTRAERGLCHGLVRIPADPAHPSLNLAQAVLLLAYEARLAGPPAAALPRPAAPAGDLEAALGQLREALLAVGFLNPQNPDARLAELRRLLARGRPTPREVTLLRGLARQVAWGAGQRASLRTAAGCADNRRARTMMAGDELRVPTVVVAVEITWADGRRARGDVFLPLAGLHPDEGLAPSKWLNSPPLFFPFRPAEAPGSILVNKRQVAALSLAVTLERPEEEVEAPVCWVRVETAGATFAGALRLERPAPEQRVLDVLNGSGEFMALRDGEREHLVSRAHVARVIEGRAEPGA
jgi:TrmH family RNA methyltransferase